jgi:hypothetical protein
MAVCHWFKRGEVDEWRFAIGPKVEKWMNGILPLV